MDLGAAIRSTGAVRAFRDEAVDDATLHAVLDDARFAPSGGNRQGWRVVVVKDTALRRCLGELMQPVWDDYCAIGATGVTPFAADGAPQPDVTAVRVPNQLIDTIADIPVVLVVGADLSQLAMMDGDLARAPITGGASIYPFCWNLILAARSRGLGGVITTFLARAEDEAAQSLGLPAHHGIAAVIFLGRPVHQPTKLRRAPVESFTTIDRFDGETFHG
ncbi:MAG TPA: nitroreductase family protein [Ilumatobacteraceae bacterium]|jgi:nitroreductase